MSTFVLMRILESAPRRYDLGIRLLTLGRLEKVYDHLASFVTEGQRVLDLGCGTGALTLRAARRSAKVKGIDINAEMLQIAERRARDEDLSERVELQLMGVGELGGERAESYDVVMSGLCLSELSDEELDFMLKQVVRILEPDGLLLVVDEVRPSGFSAQLAYWLVRGPLVVLTYLLAQRTTHPIADLRERLEDVSLSIEAVKLHLSGSLIEIVARKPARSMSWPR